MGKYVHSNADFYFLQPANYNDYRDFLKDRFDKLKAANPKYSLTVCAQKSKISKSQLQFLFQKKRHLNIDRLPDLALALKITDEEEYFTYLLLCFNSSRSHKVKAHFIAILNRLRHQYVKINEPRISETTEVHKKDLYENSLLMLLQEIVKLKDFREDPDWILENLRVPQLSSKQITEGFEFLLKIGCLTRDKNKRLQSNPVSIWRPDPFDPDGQKVYTNAAKSVAHLMQNPKQYKPSVYSAMAVTFDEKNLIAAEKYLIEVHHHLCKLSNDSKDPTALVQIGNFMLTVARL